MNKIYLVSALSRESYDDTTFIVDAFESEEVAQKVANGLDDVDEYLSELWNVKLVERDEKLSVLSDEASGEEYDAIYEEYNQYEHWFSYIYSVVEVDLIKL